MLQSALKGVEVIFYIYFVNSAAGKDNNLFSCCRKHAFVHLTSETDLTKALALNGEKLLDKPMKITKAKIKSEDKVKMKAPSLDKKGKKEK